MKSRIFGSSKSKTQPPVDIGPSAYPSPLPQDSRSSTPQQYRPSQLQPEKEGQTQIAPSSSQRHSTVPAFDRPPVDAAGPAYAPQPPVDERFQDHRYSYRQPNPLVAPPEKEQRRGFRERIGLGGHNAKQNIEQPAGQVSRASGVGRTLSVRRKEASNPDKLKSSDEQQSQQWALRPNSTSQLVPHNEEEEEEQHNTFQLQQQYRGPPVPEKDPPQQEQYYFQAPPAGQQSQDYYPPPPAPLQRANTGHSFPSGAENFNPTAQQHPALQEPQHQQYQSYSEPQLQQDQQSQYQQQFPPQSAPQLAQYPPPPSQEAAFAYNTPEDTEYSRSRQQSVQHPQEPQSAHPSRPSFEQPPLHPQFQSVPDLVQPQPSRVPAHQHSASQDPLFLQPPRGASLQPNHPHPPPSPLQPGVPEENPQQPVAPQPPSPNDTTSSSATMPRDPPNRGGNTVRQVDPKNMAPPGSREGSNLGQTTLPPTPGFVQPGPQSGRPGQPPTDERGRESPVPKGDFAEEDLAHYHQLIKEHKELRDKYQKVKKYYFEKESQVHALQNTLAHQRLSQSRTSLDDSEYSARFSRLEGLISQLAFSIRKSWKTVPEFLARVVNRDAVVTGKQEMTAVGRAVISHWLICEVFDRFFHPNLELGLSMQLKQIYNNIRRYAPPFQSGEEEEALNSKLINWRLTTFDGLQDRLKSPEAAEHHQRLLAQLNEKLVADMSALLQDPAPPDLSGGVYMIIELAVNIAVHLPQESRDVVIEYYLPGTPINPDLMKIEAGIPALVVPVASDNVSEGGDHASLKSSGTGEAKEQDRASASTVSSGVLEDQGVQGTGGPTRDVEPGKKRGVFGIMSSSASKKPVAVSAAPGGASNGKGNNAGATGSHTALSGPGQGGRETPTQGEAKEQRVRMAVGVSVQIRGRSVLGKAPVYGVA